MEYFVNHLMFEFPHIYIGDKKMKKIILPILAIGILVLSGLGASAIPNENQMKTNPLNMDDLKLEIVVKGGILGYKATVTNVGTVPVEGELSIKITTDAKIMLLGRNLELPLEDLRLPPDESIEYNLRPVLGLGSAIITISVAMAAGGVVHTADAQTQGSVFLFYVRCNAIPLDML